MNRLVKALPLVAFLAGGSAGVYVFITTQAEDPAAFHQSIAHRPAVLGRELAMGQNEKLPRRAPRPGREQGDLRATEPLAAARNPAFAAQQDGAARQPSASPRSAAKNSGEVSPSMLRNPLSAKPYPLPATEGAVPRQLATIPTETLQTERSEGEFTSLGPLTTDEQTSPDYSLVKVFYATDRAMETATWRDVPELMIENKPLFCVSLACALLLVASYLYPESRRATAIAGGICFGFTVYFVYPTAILLIDGYRLTRDGPSYGDQRGRFEVGTSHVSVPRSHRVGEIERPVFLRLQVREDDTKHIVVRNIERKSDGEFYAELREQVESAPDRNVFVFVHGYNVTFDSAVRRTAQIAYDLRFQGAAVCYSWPSQGGLFKYTIDETNVMWTVPHLKRFLLGVVDHSGATSVNLVAHSMGNRALTEALRQLAFELQGESHLFNEVVLAAPDVDAEIFRRDLAPVITRTANRVSLYASSADQALLASKQVHGYPRAGDSGEGLVLVNGVETIDVSTIDTSLLGHSYYGDNLSILEDLADVIHKSMPAARRRWLLTTRRDGLDYWIFRQATHTAIRDDGAPYR